MMKTVGIIGLGLMGGSFAKTIHAKGDLRTLGFDIDDAIMTQALDEGVIAEGLDPQNLGECDLVIVALRPHDAITWIKENADHMKSGAIIADVAGVKRNICEELDPFCELRGLRFIGAHPMAGYHEGGFAHASADLFDGASFIMIESDHSDPAALEELGRFAQDLGFGQIVITDAENHDEMIAFTSQLAHLVSSAYIKDPDARRHAGFSAGSFQDMTRVAILDADMWSELLCENADMLIPHLDQLIGHLSEYRTALLGLDRAQLSVLLEAGVKEKRASIDAGIPDHDTSS